MQDPLIHPTSDDPELMKHRVALAEGLRSLRLGAGLSGSDLGAAVALSQSKISRIERMPEDPTENEVRAIAALTTAPVELVEELVEHARALDKSKSIFPVATEFVDSNSSQQQVHEVEKTSRKKDIFNSQLVPGLLQTSTYAEAVASCISLGSQMSASDLEERVIRSKVIRLQRQAELQDDRKRFRFLVAPSALRTVWGSAQILIDQLRVLLKMDLPTVELRILDITKPNSYASWGEYYVFDERLVHLEFPWWCPWLRDDVLVRRYVEMFENQWQQALSGGAVEQNIEDAIREVSKYEDEYIQLDSPTLTSKVGSRI